MAFLEVNPFYREFLRRQGLTTPESILALPAEIVSGHPDRHVAQVTVGRGPDAVTAYLKREHRIPWRVRFQNAWAGFGFVSKSQREFQTLQAMRQAGIGCPDCLAAGEDRQGRAFLLVRALPDTVDLRLYLHKLRNVPISERRQFAQQLGKSLAQLHNAGFDHPDLYSKHIHIHSPDRRIYFLDCQRTRQRRRVSWHRRCQDLAALQATLAEDLTTLRERLLCLRGYLEACREQHAGCAKPLAHVARSIHRYATQLLQQRRIRELHRLPLAADQQRLVWRDGEALCLTPQFQAALQGLTPDWLLLARLPAKPDSLELRSVVALPTHRPGQLLRRRQNRFWNWLWAWLHGKPLTSAEVLNAGLLFRLERNGFPVPRLLAFGQRRALPWQLESFLLTETEAETVSLAAWLQDQAHAAGGASKLRQRRHLIRESGTLLSRLHEAACHLTEASKSTQRSAVPFPLAALVVQQPKGELPQVLLGNIEAVQTCRRPSKRRARVDLQRLRDQFTGFLGSRTDELRFFLAYLGQVRLTPEARRLAGSVHGAGTRFSQLVAAIRSRALRSILP